MGETGGMIRPAPASLPVVALLVALLAALLTGCGGGGGNDYAAYCDAVKAHQDDLTDALAKGDAGLLSAIPEFKDLRSLAPDDIRDDWDTLVTALTGLQNALDDAGVTASDFKAGKPPAGVTAAQRKAIAAAATKVSSTKVQQASVDVQQHARDVCHTPLTL